MRIQQALVASAVTLTVMAGFTTMTVGSAHAAPVDLACTATSVVTFDPGLILVPTRQRITFNVDYSGCTSLTGSPVTRGRRSGSFEGVRSCLALPEPRELTLTAIWDSGPSSTVAANTQSVDAGGQVVHTIRGTVASGQFAGDAFVEVITQASLDLIQCLSGGVKSQSGAGTVVLT